MTRELGIDVQLLVGDAAYRIAEHPAAPSMPYGQEGRQATVYQVTSEQGERLALKVFKPRYRLPYLVGLSGKLAAFAHLSGLRVCRRAVLTPQRNENLLRQHPDLVYAVLMPWIEGPTWMEVLLTERELDAQQSLVLSTSLANVLATMEQQGCAHCDLSGPNVLLPSLVTSSQERPSALELVDVEGLYGPGLDRPRLLPAGSPGYAHRAAFQGLWSLEADRFAGAVLLAEMLGSCDPRVRAAAWGESYFDPGEMQRDGERYQLLARVLHERWGETVSGLFQRAWCSEALADGPTFGEWLLALPSEVRSPSVLEGGEPAILEPPAWSGRREATAPVADGSLVEKEREASALERAGKWEDANGVYDWLLAQAPGHERNPQWEEARNRCGEQVRIATLFDEGLAAYIAGEWRAAKELLGGVERQRPGFQKDGEQAAALLDRIRKAEEQSVQGPSNALRWALYALLLLIAAAAIGSAGLGLANGKGPLGFIFWTDTPTPTVAPAPTETQTPVPTSTWTPVPTSTATAAIQPAASPIPSNVYIEYVLDASNSMIQELSEDQTKLEVARNALALHWQGLQAQPHLGLRALGHRYHAVDAESCLDTELLAPAAQAQVEGLLGLVSNVTAQGMSPLAVTLREAGGDFTFASGRTNALVLIADGGDNCGGDPCQTVQFQREAGIEYPIYVAGLGVDPASREQLVCIAETSGGLYRDAPTESELLMVLDGFVSEILASER